MPDEEKTSKGDADFLKYLSKQEALETPHRPPDWDSGVEERTHG